MSASPGTIVSSKRLMREATVSPRSRASAAFTAPQPSCPRTTNNGVRRCCPAYCSVPMISGEMTFPATRTTNSSPKPASKTSSGGTRESLQPRIVAYGCCPFARSARTSFWTVGKRASPRSNRSFPADSRASASSAAYCALSFPAISAPARHKHNCCHAQAYLEAFLSRAWSSERLNPQVLFVPPDLQRDDSGLGVQLADDGAGSTPSTFFVESRGPFVADRARQPRRSDAAVREHTLGVANQRGRDAGAACFGGHEQLIQLVVFDDAETDGRADRSDDSSVGDEIGQSLSEAFERASPC